MEKIKLMVKQEPHFPDIGSDYGSDYYSPSPPSAQYSDCDPDVAPAPNCSLSHYGLHLLPQPASGRQVQWVCALCNSTFGTRSNLQRHEQTVHVPDTYSWHHFCVTCGRGFSQSSDLKKHERTHTKQRPYACPDCSKTFTQSSALSRHRSTHTGARPHVCYQCRRSFTQASSLRRHLRGCPGKCSQACSVQFALASETPKHSNSGPNLRCPVCGKVLSNNSNLKRHCLKLHGMQPKHSRFCSRWPQHCNQSN